MIQPDNEKEGKVQQKKRQGWGAFLFLVVSLSLFTIILFAGVLVSILQDRTLTLPEVIQIKLNDFLNAEPDLPEVSFESAEIGFANLFDPKLVLEGVQFSDALTGSGVRLGKLDIVFDGGALITGVLAPKSIRLYSAILDLTRKTDGSFDLGFDVSNGFTTTLSVDDIFKKTESFFTNEDFRSLELGQIEQVTVNYTDQLNRRAWTFDGGRLRVERNEGGVKLLIDLHC